MRLHRHLLEIETRPDTDVHDLSGEVAAFVAACGVREGELLVFTPGSTAGVTTIEFESGAVADLKEALDRLAPSDGEYRHNQRWGDGNGYSHVRSALLGPSLTVPIVDGKPLTGPWQQIVLCDFDNRPRRRRVVLQVIGEGAGSGESAAPRGP